MLACVVFSAGCPDAWVPMLSSGHSSCCSAWGSFNWGDAQPQHTHLGWIMSRAVSLLCHCHIHAAAMLCRAVVMRVLMLLLCSRAMQLCVHAGHC